MESATASWSPRSINLQPSTSQHSWILQFQLPCLRIFSIPHIRRRISPWNPDSNQTIIWWPIPGQALTFWCDSRQAEASAGVSWNEPSWSRRAPLALLSLAGTTSTAPAAGREPVVQDVRSFLQISRLASCINKTEPGSRLSYSHSDSDNFIREILTSRPLPAPRRARPSIGKSTDLYRSEPVRGFTARATPPWTPRNFF